MGAEPRDATAPVPAHRDGQRGDPARRDVAALIWANVAAGSYESLWSTRLSVNLGGMGLSDTLHGWVNSGLMTFFFLVVGLEARREFDMGELRERRRLTLPLSSAWAG